MMETKRLALEAARSYLVRARVELDNVHDAPMDVEEVIDRAFVALAAR